MPTETPTETRPHPLSTAMSSSPMRFASLLGPLLGILAAAPLGARPADGKLVVQAGRVVPIHGPEIVDGVVVIEDGRIVAVGPADEVDVPWDAEVIGGPDHVAFPGFVEAHTSSGTDRSNENIDVTPYLDVRDSVDPVDFFYEECQRWGITTINVQQGNETVIGGQGRVVKPVGMTVEEMTVRPSFGLKLSAAPKRGKSRATQSQALRGAFRELREHLEELVEEKRQGRDEARREALYQGRDLEGERAQGRAMRSTGWSVEGLEAVPRGEIDEQLEPLLDLAEGREAAFFWCGRPMDVHRALEVARDNGFLARTTLVLDASCWKAVDVIAEAGVPVILDGDMTHRERDPLTGEEIETFVPPVYEEAGVRYALSSENSSNRTLWYQAALAVGGGIPRETALEAVTRTPAEILGLGDRVGGLAEGMDGNVLLLTGDPLDVTTWVDYTIVEGEVVYDRSEDMRRRHLMENVTPPGSEPARRPFNPFGNADAAADPEEEGDRDGTEEEDE